MYSGDTPIWGCGLARHGDGLQRIDDEQRVCWDLSDGTYLWGAVGALICAQNAEEAFVRRDPSIVSSNLTNPTFDNSINCNEHVPSYKKYLLFLHLYIIRYLYTYSNIYRFMRKWECIKVEDAMFENIVSIDTNESIKFFENMAHKYYIWCDGIFIESSVKPLSL